MIPLEPGAAPSVNSDRLARLVETAFDGLLARHGSVGEAPGRIEVVVGEASVSPNGDAEATAQQIAGAVYRALRRR